MKGLNGVKIGFSYIKDLGVMYVQFLFIYDYCMVDEIKLNELQFNWGYDLKNYNVSEGFYLINLYNFKMRIIEFK